MKAEADRGAYDTEPRAVLFKALDTAADGRKVKVPETADDWSLYDGGDREDVAHILHLQCQKVVKMIGELPEEFRGQVKSIIREDR
jgi:hypothetical protein